MHDQENDSLHVAVNSLKHLRIEMTEASRRHLVSRCAQEPAISKSRLLLLRIQDYFSAPQRTLAISMSLVILLGGTALLFSLRNRLEPLTKLLLATLSPSLRSG